MKVQHIDSIYGDEVWCNDIEMLGDAFVMAGDTLTILSGTQIRTSSNSDVSSRSDDFDNGRVEIVAKGGHVDILGTNDSPVVLAPKPGSSSTFQLEGVYCRDGGTAYINHADFKYSYMALQGYNRPKSMTIKNSRIENQGMIYVNYQNVDSTDKVFHAESCYVGNRIQIFYGGNLCTVHACTLDGEYYEGATIEYSEQGIPKFTNCYIEGKNYRCVRMLTHGKAKFVDCTFDGSELSSGNYVFLSYDNTELYIDTCIVDVAGANGGIYTSTSPADVVSRHTIFEDYTFGARLRGGGDFGTLENPGHNCFLDDADTAIWNDNSKYNVYAQWNYFDTLLFKGDSIECDSTDALCEPDTSLHKIYTASGKVTIPKTYTLGPAVPNPFNSSVEISFEIPEKTNVELAIYDVTGHIVKYIISTELDAGSYTAVWDGKDYKGKNMPSGVYLYRLRCDGFDDTKKMTLIR